MFGLSYINLGYVCEVYCLNNKIEKDFERLALLCFAMNNDC